jgi:hypothetical protein
MAIPKKLGIAAGIDEFEASTRINRYEKGVHEASMEVAQQHRRCVANTASVLLYRRRCISRHDVSVYGVITRRKNKGIGIGEKSGDKIAKGRENAVNRIS